MEKVYPNRIIGFKEFADFLGIERSTLNYFCDYYRHGTKVSKPAPAPVHILSTTPLWTLDQAIEYKKKYFSDVKEA